MLLFRRTRDETCEDQQKINLNWMTDKNSSQRLGIWQKRLCWKQLILTSFELKEPNELKTWLEGVGSHRKEGHQGTAVKGRKDHVFAIFVVILNGLFVFFLTVSLGIVQYFSTTIRLLYLFCYVAILKNKKGILVCCCILVSLRYDTKPSLLCSLSMVTGSIAVSTIPETCCLRTNQDRSTKKWKPRRVVRFLPIQLYSVDQDPLV